MEIYKQHNQESIIDLTGKALKSEDIEAAAIEINKHYGLPRAKFKGQEKLDEMFLEALDRGLIDLGI